MSPNDRSRLANEVLSNDVYGEAFRAVESRLVETWKSSRDFEVREDSWHRLQALHDVRQQLDTFIATAALETTAKG